MTTTKQVKRVLGDMVARHDDLVLDRRDIILRPVRHSVRFILIDRTSGANSCRPCWYSVPFVEPRWAPEHGDLSRTAIGGRDGFMRRDIYPGPRAYPRAFPYDLDNADFVAALINELETVTLPLLRAHSDLTMIRATKDALDGKRRVSISTMMLDIALGDFDSAEAILDQIEEGWALEQQELSKRDRSIPLLWCLSMCGSTKPCSRISSVR